MNVQPVHWSHVVGFHLSQECVSGASHVYTCFLLQYGLAAVPDTNSGCDCVAYDQM